MSATVEPRRTAVTRALAKPDADYIRLPMVLRQCFTVTGAFRACAWRSPRS